MTDADKKKQQYSLVVKSNEMIRKSRFSLSVSEQRIILYLISKIKPNEADFREYEFELKDFCEVCGIEYGPNRAQLKETIKELADKSLWITIPGGAETLVRWVEKPYLYPDSGKVKIRLDRDMIPYLLQLKENFTQYELIATLALKSKFSLRLYELLKSYEYQSTYTVSIGDLRKMMMLTTEYPKTNDFRRYVIDRAIDEINRFTDIEVSYAVERTGRSISTFIFSIEKAEDFNGRYNAAELFLDGQLPTRHQLNKRYKEMVKGADAPNPNQISLFDDIESGGGNE